MGETRPMSAQISRTQSGSAADGNAARKVEQEIGAKPDVRQLMEQIRARISQDAEKFRDRRRVFKAADAQIDPQNARKSGELLNSEELRYLNTHYSYSTELELEKIVSHRPGLIGKLVVTVKRKLLSFLWNRVLRQYFEREREYQAHVVRFLNDSAKYIDARDGANFWELIRKIDYDVTKALERIERINDEQTASMRMIERRFGEAVQRSIGTVQEQTAVHAAQLKTLDSVVRGIEAILAGLPKSLAHDAVGFAQTKSVSHETSPDFSYLLLENRYRGSEQEISKRLEIYPQFFNAVDKPVLEIGGGRGELQLLFSKAGITSYCVDLDQAMVQRAKVQGVDARLGDGLEHLRGLPDKSLAGVIAVQVVEHLTRDQLRDLFASCMKKVVSGGRIIFETINPQSLLALSSNYFRDPTHVWPLHPDTLEYAMNLAGLRTVEIRKLSPVAEGGQLQRIPLEEFMSPRWRDSISALNKNIEQLNSLVYGYQDYCIVAEVP